MYINPYENLNNGLWIKTNFHTHAGTEPGTCGQNPIDSVQKLYRDLGYGALCISNHDLYTNTEPLSDNKLFMIQGVEYSQNEHILTIGVNESYHQLAHQEAIDETVKHGGFAILCHPNWIHKEYWPYDKLDNLHGFKGLEIINMLIYRLSGSGLATDTWDYLLKKGRLVWGFGNDDFHMPFDAGRSFNLIFAETNNYEGIKKAIDAGRFAASTGVYIDHITLDNNVLRIKAKYPTETYIDKFRYKFVSENGIVKEQYDREAEYELINENYVRVEVVAENGAMLFTQPVYKESFFK